MDRISASRVSSLFVPLVFLQCEGSCSARHSGRQYKFAMYHVPMYPARRQYSNANSAAVRREWEPIFDKYLSLFLSVSSFVVIVLCCGVLSRDTNEGTT